MPFPSDDLTTTHLDAGTDDPTQARTELYNTVLKIKAIIASYNAASGICPLDATSFVPSANLDGSTITTLLSLATTSLKGLMSADQFNKLAGIAANANNYTLPPATASVLGGVKAGEGLNVDAGVLSVATKLQYKKYTTSGTFTVPTGVTQLFVHGCGGGGGGGRCAVGTDPPQPWAAAGGGGSGYEEKMLFTGYTSGHVCTVTIGAGGVGADYVSNSTAGTGGTSEFENASSVMVGVGAGGTGGGNASEGQSGLGGVGEYNGGNGAGDSGVSGHGGGRRAGAGLVGSGGGGNATDGYGGGGGGGNATGTDVQSDGGDGGGGFIIVSWIGADYGS